MKLRIGCLVVGFLLFVLSLSAQTASSASPSSQVPPLIQFSNVATDEGGNSLSGVVNLTFSLYAAQQGGEPLWTETQSNIPLDTTGHYSVQLGITKPNGVPTTLFTTGEARWLGVRIAEQAEQPRVLLLSVPYALKAGDAATIGGLPPSAFVLAAPPSGATSAYTGEAAAEQSAPPPSATDVTTTGGTIDFLPLFNGTSTILDSMVFQLGTGTTAKIGINTTTPATTLDVKGAGTIRGVLALPATAAATAAKGAISQPLDLVASAFNSTSSTAVNQTFQWQAEPAANDTTSPSGTLNLLFGTGATKPSETGLHIANNGQITFAAGQKFPGTGGGTITGVTTASTSGLTGGGTSGTLNLALTSACAKNQVLQWNGTAWACAAVGTGTVTSVASGAGLTGGPITGSGTLSIATGGVTNAMLATSYAQLGTANTFTTNQTVNGTLFAASSSLGVQATTTSVNGVGINALSSATSGTGAGVIGASNSPNGEGVIGTNNATTGTAPGVYGTSSSATGYGVEGAVSSPAAFGVFGSNAATTGTAPGVYGTTASPAGFGVEGSVSSPSGYGVYGTNFVTTGSTAGVYGATASPAGYGVQGANFATSGGSGVYGTGSTGVFGQAQGCSACPSAGVSGMAAGTSGESYGVLGISQSPEGWAVAGVNGAETGNTAAVQGETFSAAGYGVQGLNGSGSGVGVEGEGLTGVFGWDTSPAGNGNGVYGTSTNGNGVFGTSGVIGVVGTADGFSQLFSGVGLEAGVWGDTGGISSGRDEYVGVIASADSNIALLADNNDSTGDYPTMLVQNFTAATHNPVFQTGSPNTYSDSRHCTIDTSANLTCTGVVSGVVTGDDGKQTAMYAMQSAENWFEDAGSGQLSNGSARIELDPAFARTVNAGVEYHVFLTPNGDSKGLYVSQKTATSFQVHEQGGGTSSIAFDYRIMAKRKGYENVRLEDLTDRFKRPEAPLRKTHRPLPSAEIKSVPAARKPMPPVLPLVAPRPIEPRPILPKAVPLAHPAALASKPEVTQK
jgi:hypothetical protein